MIGGLAELPKKKGEVQLTVPTGLGARKEALYKPNS
jgi:hypothetical protein